MQSRRTFTRASPGHFLHQSAQALRLPVCGPVQCRCGQHANAGVVAKTGLRKAIGGDVHGAVGTVVRRAFQIARAAMLANGGTHGNGRTTRGPPGGGTTLRVPGTSS